MKYPILLAALTVASSSHAQVYKKDAPFAHTFSIVARDSATGDMAVGVQSHWFSVGTAVSWGQKGVGVVATQSFVDKSYGMLGLQMMQQGSSATNTLQKLVENDAGRDVRQVAMIDARGNVAAHTGAKCIDYASHIVGPNFSVQSNMMLGSGVCEAMAAAFRYSYGKPLSERIMASMMAAQQAGGDIRGQQSAALLVVSGNKDIPEWNGRLVDLRVDDHPEPLKELDRLLRIHTAYEHMNNGDLAVEKNDMTLAMKEYNAAMLMFPDNLEMQYWTAITLANNKEVPKAAKMLQAIYAKDDNWRELTKRLPKVGLLNVSKEEMERLVR